MKNKKLKKPKLPKGETIRDIDLLRWGSITTDESRKIDIEKITKIYINEHIKYLISEMEKGNFIQAYRDLEYLQKMINSTGKVLNVVRQYTLDTNNQLKSLRTINIFGELHNSKTQKIDLYQSLQKPMNESILNKVDQEMIKELKRHGYEIKKVTKDNVKK